MELLHPAACRAGFADVREAARRLVEQAPPEALLRPPAPGRWSAAECLDHLNRTGGPLAPRLEAALRRARAEGRTGAGPFGYGLLGRLFLRAVDPSGARPLRAPAAYRPAAALDVGAVAADFMRLQDALMRCAEAAEGIDLRRVRAASPAFPLLRLPVSAWLAGTLAHERRHLRQAEQAAGVG